MDVNGKAAGIYEAVVGLLFIIDVLYDLVISAILS
jgi:hypothetical protein